MDLNAALKWLNDAVINNVGQDLREPELVILRGTWRGLTYEQMATSSDYSTNYLMRDVAPKLWKQLSNVFGRSVGKTNFRVALEAYAAANHKRETQFNFTDGSSAADLLKNSALISTVSLEEELEAYWHPSRSPAPGDALKKGSQRRDLKAGSETVYSGISVSAAAAVMVGYSHELAQLTHWVSETQASSATESASQRQPTGGLVGIWGLHGVGKTLLVKKLIAQVGESFDGVVSRQLTGQSIDELSASILSELGKVPQANQTMNQLLALMRQKPLLIVLEGTEAILQSGVLAGDYQVAHRGYREFFQSVIGSRSCVVVTGIEGPSDLVGQGENEQGENGRSLILSSLSKAAAIELLQTLWQAKPHTSTPASNLEQWPELVARCQGHPLALKAALRVIQEIFNGQIDDFLAQSSVLFTDILRRLAPSFNRLSSTEIDVLYWLAGQEIPLSLKELQQTLPLLGSAKLVSVLYSLKQRSLLEINTQNQSPTFCLPTLVKSYAIHQFINHLSDKQSSTASLTSAQIIDLNPSSASNLLQLSQWFQGQFKADWQSLAQLFASSAHPAMRLRSIYHLQDKTFIKRFKPISLSAKTAAKGILLVAIRPEAENQYKVCVQAQPAQDASLLPARLTLSLLDAQQNVLATVIAQPDDSFIQLPYFRGAIAQPFSIELTLGDYCHTETFVI
ncbi:MAG: DUF1822 family protein [Phormidesmis sp.]